MKLDQFVSELGEIIRPSVEFAAKEPFMTPEERRSRECLAMPVVMVSNISGSIRNDLKQALEDELGLVLSRTTFLPHDKLLIDSKGMQSVVDSSSMFKSERMPKGAFPRREKKDLFTYLPGVNSPKVIFLDQNDIVSDSSFDVLVSYALRGSLVVLTSDSENEAEFENNAQAQIEQAFLVRLKKDNDICFEGVLHKTLDAG